MASSTTRLSTTSFQRLRVQIGVAAARCTDDQLLDLADDLHARIRGRTARRHELAPPSEARPH